MCQCYLSSRCESCHTLFLCACAGDLASLDVEVKQQVCCALESEGCWEKLAHSLGLGILNTAFGLSPSPAKTLLQSYEVTHMLTCLHTHTSRKILLINKKINPN